MEVWKLIRSLEAWRFGGLEEPQRLRPGLSPPATVWPNAARLSQRSRRTTKIHKGLPEWETADYANWSRLGAGYRRQDCQNGKRRLFRRFARKTFGNTDLMQILGVLARGADAPRRLADWLIGGVWGGAPPTKPSL